MSRRRIIIKPEELTENQLRELEESKRVLEMIAGDNSEIPIGRPKTLEDFKRILEEIRINELDSEVRCKNCAELYFKKFNIITEGYCTGCAAEIFYGDISQASIEVGLMNFQQAQRNMRAYDSQAEAQKAKRGMTMGG